MIEINIHHGLKVNRIVEVTAYIRLRIIFFASNFCEIFCDYLIRIDLQVIARQFRSFFMEKLSCLLQLRLAEPYVILRSQVDIFLAFVTLPYCLPWI
jgi:hypothetical protein